ncbi:unnamed protein product (plasmid) [Mycetohabitans rhizoxinica HKI 454]|uniref:Uncharacterized protein n=1 Tax=Mycetohabitans rhizoxinica (strain DSM 19002 / CIP 109453 / HKI 454) TaxID=882378 RepID=E5ATM2_MYCRK|nr:unnamed protein product [Mycetohabitans rhizoxinica HKI 454]
MAHAQHAQDVAIRVSARVDVAAARLGMRSHKVSLNEADAALHAAKRSG